MKQRRSFAWLDFLWLAFLGGLAATAPNLQFHDYLILLAIGGFQLFEYRILEWVPQRGRYYTVILKIALCSLLVEHTNGIFSSYYLIYILPVVTAAIYFDLWAMLAWTIVTCAAYYSFLIWELTGDIDPATGVCRYEPTMEVTYIPLAIRALFLFLAAILVNRFVTENREQTTRYRELAETLADTNRKLEQAQEEARRSERLAALGQLSAGLAHELRNPLAVIKGSAETLSRKLAGSDPITNEMAEYISSEVNRMNSLVTRFLDFARPHKLEMREERIPPLIERALKAARERWPDAPVLVEREFAPDLPAVAADGELIERVFTNLALNAYEAMNPGGGKLRVSAVPSSDGKQGVEITFQDSGPGIPAELREQIFNPFFTTKDTGVGLGLSIVSKIVDDHRGWIHLTSEPGKGASFQIFLPQGS